MRILSVLAFDALSPIGWTRRDDWREKPPRPEAAKPTSPPAPLAWGGKGGRRMQLRPAMSDNAGVIGP